MKQSLRQHGLRESATKVRGRPSSARRSADSSSAVWEIGRPHSRRLPPLKITDVRVIVTCPERNYVLLKIMTSEPGLYGVGDATLLDPYHLFFLEDLWRPEHKESFRMIRRHSTTPLAMGELFTSLWDCVPLIAEQLIDFIRCDIAHIGGITAARKIAALAEPFQVNTAWHGPADVGPPTHAANVHLDCAIPNFGVQEMVFFPDVAREVIPGGPVFRDGSMIIDDSPGLATDVNEKLAIKYPYRRAYLPIARRADASMHDW